MPPPHQCGIQAVSVTHTSAHGNTWPPTHWEKPGIIPTSSRILVGFISAEQHGNSFLFFQFFCEIFLRLVGFVQWSRYLRLNTCLKKRMEAMRSSYWICHVRLWKIYFIKSYVSFKPEPLSWLYYYYYLFIYFAKYPKDNTWHLMDTKGIGSQLNDEASILYICHSGLINGSEDKCFYCIKEI